MDLKKEMPVISGFVKQMGELERASAPDQLILDAYNELMLFEMEAKRLSQLEQRMIRMERTCGW